MEAAASLRVNGQKTGMAGLTGGISQWTGNSGAVNLARCHDLGPIQAILAELVDHCLVDGLTRVPLGGIVERQERQLQQERREREQRQERQAAAASEHQRQKSLQNGSSGAAVPSPPRSSASRPQLEAQISAPAGIPTSSSAVTTSGRAPVARSSSLGPGPGRDQGGGEGVVGGDHMGNGMMPNNKSKSTSQLSAADPDWVAPHQNTVTHVDPHAPLAGLPPGEGRKRRLGLLGAKRTTITVHRSEGEPDLIPDTCSESSWLTSQSQDGQLSEFIE